MSEPLDPVTAGLASVLKSLRTRVGLTEDRLAATELALDTLTGLESVREHINAGDTAERAVIKAVSAAVGTLEPTYSIVADVSLGLGLAADLLPDADLYATDLSSRRTALLENWDRLHELRSATYAGQTPTMRTLRLEIETNAFGALALALTDADSRRASWASGAPGVTVPQAGDASPDRYSSGTVPSPFMRSQIPLLLEEFRRIAAALRDALVLDGDGCGWPHDLRKGSRPVTALSTSYGLKAMLLLEDSLAPELIPVARHLRQSASGDGGYAARTQAAPSPEATAAVLPTLHRIDGTANLEKQIAAMKRELGDFEKTRPFILTCLLEASVQLGRDPGLTRSLIKDLLAARRQYGSLLLWPEKAERDLVAPAASIAHTARAVRALALADAARPANRPADDLDIDAIEAANQAAAWLAEQQDLGNVSEYIDRQLPDQMESVYIRHFTAAWVVKALVSIGLPASHPSVSAAVNRVWSDYSIDDALWRWKNGDLPVWMTCDAIDALRLAALAATIRSGGIGAS
jgi:hypothetical protein